MTTMTLAKALNAGLRKAMEIALLSDVYDAPEALRLGLAENACRAGVTEVAYEGNLTHVGLHAADGTHLKLLLGAGDTAPEGEATLGFAAAEEIGRAHV